MAQLRQERVRSRLHHIPFDYPLRPYSLRLTDYFVRASEPLLHPNGSIDDSTNIQHVTHPPPPPPPSPKLSPRRMRGAQNYTGTLYLLFQTLVDPSLITESKYHIKRYNNKTTTVVVFTVSIHTVLSLNYIYIYKNLHLHLHNQSAKPTDDGLLQVCWPSRMQKTTDVLLYTYTD